MIIKVIYVIGLIFFISLNTVTIYAAKQMGSYEPTMVIMAGLVLVVSLVTMSGYHTLFLAPLLAEEREKKGKSFDSDKDDKDDSSEVASDAEVMEAVEGVSDETPENVEVAKEESPKQEDEFLPAEELAQRPTFTLEARVVDRKGVLVAVGTDSEGCWARAALTRGVVDESTIERLEDVYDVHEAADVVLGA